MKSSGWDARKELVAMATECFIAFIGVFPIELLAHQVLMVCAANCQDISIYKSHLYI